MGGVHMFSLKVSGMTCGGCVNAITRALQTQDSQARVEADLGAQTVQIESVLNPELVRQLIVDAGFPVMN